MDRKRIISMASVAAVIFLSVLSTVFVLKSAFLEKELKRSETLTRSRAYEGIISSLCEYKRSEDAGIGVNLSFYFSTLPLSSEDIDISVRFCRDISVSADDRGARERSLEYSSLLLSYMEKERAVFFSGRPYLPEYVGDTDIPASAEAGRAEKFENEGYLKRAQALLGSTSALTLSSRIEGEDTMLTFTSHSSFAEYSKSTGRLTRALVGGYKEKSPSLSEERARENAQKLIFDNLYSGMKVTDTEENDRCFLFEFEGKDSRVKIGIGGTGELVFFIAS